MRITAIRGKGLASLFDPFEVLLDQGPLAQSGLYCISGQTGAGKSTILDAMCLALFGETPRLTGRSKSKIGRIAPGEDDLRLSDRDPRALLSRGCGEGFAEVEFIGVDQEKYRARWSIRRSRRSSSGRLQKASVELQRVADNKVLSDHPTTRTLAEISNKLGLSFEQFCRSVLLAQGDFSAFLRADDKERADLLERMTGTEVYRKLSKACHLRNRNEQALAQSAKDAVAALEIWDAQTLQARQAQREQAQMEVDRAQAKLSAQQALHEARKRRTTLQERLREASSALETATLAWEQARVDRDKLAVLMAVQKLRPLHQQGSALQSKFTSVKEALAKTALGYQAATQAAAQAKQKLQLTKAQLETCQQEYQAKAPQRRAAQALDLQLQQLRQTQQEQEQKLQALEIEFQKARASKAKSEQRSRDLEAKLSKIDEAWPEYARSVELYARREELCGVLEELLELQKEHQDKQKSIGVRQEEQGSLQLQQKETQASMQQIERTLAACPTSSTEREVQDSGRAQQLGQASARCQGALALAKEVFTAQQYRHTIKERKVTLVAQCETLEATIAARVKDVEQARTSGRELEIRRDEARLLRDEAHAQQVMLEHRDLLREGSPCPLCGSTEHPLIQKEQASQPDAFDLASKRLQKLEEAQKTQRSALQELEKQQIAQRTRLDASRRELDEAKAQDATNALRAKELTASFHAELDKDFPELDESLANALGELRETTFESDVRGAKDRVMLMSALSAKVDEALATLNQALAQAAKRRAELDQLRSRQERLFERERVLAPKLAKSGAELARLMSEDQALVDRSKALRSRLSAMWKETPGPWTTRIESLASLHEQVLTWLGSLQEAMQQRRGYEEQRQEVQAQLLKQIQECELQDKRVQDLRALRETSVLRSREAQSERAKLLGGSCTELIASAFERETKELALAIQAAQDGYELQSKTATEQLARRESLGEQLSQLEMELTQTQAQLARAVEDLGIPNAEVQPALEVPESRIDAMRQTQRRLELAVNESATLVKSRDEDLRADQEAIEMLPEPLEIQASLTLATEQFEQTQKKLVEIEHAIEQNAAKLDQRQSLAKAHQEQLEQAQRWAKLNALIGHSEGLSFQKFAQGLSLDRLLLLANQHLQDIDRRYRLSRVHGDSLDLQVVDTMMGDEIRSIHSLSGGESFLISLALALGLSSLSAMHTKVESLFIDEGFGTLDRESLEQVLAALDALQASGRQVGLISHVEGMAEQLGARVEVRPLGHGKSKITVQGANR